MTSGRPLRYERPSLPSPYLGQGTIAASEGDVAEVLLGLMGLALAQNEAGEALPLFTEAKFCCCARVRGHLGVTA